MLKARIEELENTPDRLLSVVTARATADDLPGATKAQDALKAKFPQAPENQKAQQHVAVLKAKLDRAQEQARQLEAQGFKALPVQPSLDAGPVKLSVGVPTLQRQFVFDRYDDRYHYHDADRDHRFVVVTATATAGKGQHDPDLPGVALYRVDGKALRKVDAFALRFTRWESYATYLGNYGDSRNDFAKASAIPFVYGVQVDDETATKRPLYVVATKRGCMTRLYARFDNPPVSYNAACPELAASLALSDLAGEKTRLQVVRRLD